MIFSLDQIVLFFMIMARIVGLIVVGPIFSRKEVFAMGKVAIIFWLTFMLMYTIPLPESLPDTQLAFFLMMLADFLIGAIIGVIMQLLVIGVEFAGSLMDTQAGLSVAALLDPSLGRQVTILSLMLNWVAIIIFLQIDGHHLILSSLIQSFKILPIGVPVNISQASYFMAQLGSQLFYIAMTLSAPVLLIVFITDFAFGLLNRVAEQVNVFQLGFQIKPSVSLIVFLGMIPGLVETIAGIMEDLTEQMLTIFFYLQA